MLVPSLLVAEDVSRFSALFESPLLPDLPRLLRLEIPLKDEAKLRETSSERDERDCELERAGDPLFDGSDKAAGDELDDSSSDTDVDVDESSLIIILSWNTSSSSYQLPKISAFSAGLALFFFPQRQWRRGILICYIYKCCSYWEVRTYGV